MKHEVFSAGCEKHRPFMLLVARRKLGSWADAEDAVQDAMLSLWRRVEHLDESESRALFSTFLIRATLAACTDLQRSNLRRGERQCRYAASRQVPLPIEQQTVLREALDRVPPEYAKAMYEVFGQEATYREVAAELGMSAEALRSKLRRFKEDVQST